MDLILQKEKRALVLSLAEKKRKWKKNVSARKKTLEDVMRLKGIDDIDIRGSLIQALILIALDAVNRHLQARSARVSWQKIYTLRRKVKSKLFTVTYCYFLIFQGGA